MENHWPSRDGIESCDVLPNIPKASTVQLILCAGKSHLSLIIYVCFGKDVLRHKGNRHKSVTPYLMPPLWGRGCLQWSVLGTLCIICWLSSVRMAGQAFYLPQRFPESQQKVITLDKGAVKSTVNSMDWGLHRARPIVEVEVCATESLNAEKAGCSFHFSYAYWHIWHYSLCARFPQFLLETSWGITHLSYKTGMNYAPCLENQRVLSPIHFFHSKSQEGIPKIKRIRFQNSVTTIQLHSPGNALKESKSAHHRDTAHLCLLKYPSPSPGVH